MLVNSVVLGPVEVAEENIFHLPNGLLGFERDSTYALVTKKDEDVTLMWLQAVDANVPCFVVFDARDIVEDYDPIVEPGDMKALDCQDKADLRFLVIAVVPEDINDITVNLKSPVVLNTRNRRARQVILGNKDYPIKLPLFSEPPEEQVQA